MLDREQESTRWPAASSENLMSKKEPSTMEISYGKRRQTRTPKETGPEEIKNVSWTEKEMGSNCSRQDQGLISYETREATCTSCTEKCVAIGPHSMFCGLERWKPKYITPSLVSVYLIYAKFPYPILSPCSHSHFLEWQTVFQLSASQKETMSNPKKIQADTIR